MSSARLWVNTASIAQFSHFVQLPAGSKYKDPFKHFTTVVPRRIEGSRRNSMMSEILNLTQKPETLGVLGYNQVVCTVFLKSFALAEFKKIRIHKKILGVSHHIC